MPSATVSYRTDGKICRVKSEQGVQENGTSIIDLGGEEGVSRGGYWIADFVEKRFEIHQYGNNDNADANAQITITIREQALQQILSSVSPLLSSKAVLSTFNDAIEQDTDSISVTSPQNDESEPWSFSADCPIVLRAISDHDNEWVEGSIEKSSLIVNGSGVPTEMKCGKVTVRSLMGDAFFIIPSLRLSQGEFVLC